MTTDPATTAPPTTEPACTGSTLCKYEMILESTPATYDDCDPEGYSKCIEQARNDAQEDVIALMEQWMLAGIPPDNDEIQEIYATYAEQCDEMTTDIRIVNAGSEGVCEDGCFECPISPNNCDGTPRQTLIFNNFLGPTYWKDVDNPAGDPGSVIATAGIHVPCQTQVILSLTTTTTTSTTSTTSTTNTTPNTDGG